MCPLRENARRICKETAVAAVAMAETTEIRLARLESDVAHIRADVADLKTDVRGIRQELGGLRDDRHKEPRGLGDEIRREFRALRDEMRREFGELHKEVAANRKAMIRGDLTTRIWMLLLCAAMLGVMAHGLHWL